MPDSDSALDVVYLVSANPLLSRAGSTMPEIARLSCPRAALISLPDAAEHDDQIELR